MKGFSMVKRKKQVSAAHPYKERLAAGPDFFLLKTETRVDYWHQQIKNMQLPASCLEITESASCQEGKKKRQCKGFYTRSFRTFHSDNTIQYL